jgi:hypothetical protein
MKFIIDWAFGLFRKPELEITIEKYDVQDEWPFPVKTEKRKPQVKKATTRTAKKPVAKKAVAKKNTKKAK